jgi:hypothetical protein
MSPEISERAFEDAIACALLQNGPDACPGDATAVRESAPPYAEDPVPGGYRKRQPEDYDRALCLILADAIDFLLATQPKDWEKLPQHHGAEVKERFLARLSREIARRGALDVLLVSCKRSPEPVYLRWKALEKSARGDFFVRSGPGTVRLGETDVEEYVRTRFPQESGASARGRRGSE